VDNASTLIYLFPRNVLICASLISAQNVTVDTTHAVEDYKCSGYKCFILDLDRMATACDIIDSVTEFILGNRAKKILVVTTSTYYFYRTLYNKCKKVDVFGCN